MKTTAQKKFEQEFNERMGMVVSTMYENKEWKEILSQLSKEQQVRIIALTFLSTAVKKGSEKAFINRVMAMLTTTKGMGNHPHQITQVITTNK